MSINNIINKTESETKFANLTVHDIVAYGRINAKDTQALMVNAYLPSPLTITGGTIIPWCQSTVSPSSLLSPYAFYDNNNTIYEFDGLSSTNSFTILKVKEDGKYSFNFEISGLIYTTVTDFNTDTLNILINGDKFFYNRTIIPSGFSGGYSLNLSVIMDLVNGDSIQVQVFKNTVTGTLTLSDQEISPELQAGATMSVVRL